MTSAPTTIDLWQPRTGRSALLRWTRRRRLRHDLAHRDRVTAQLAELHEIRWLIDAANTLVRGGWVQKGWVAHRTERGELQVAVGWNAYRDSGLPVAGACLVGAITHAGGGPAAIERQPVQRAFDLTWHTLFGDRAGPVRYCPAPEVRAAHLRELIRWNDDARRTGSEVEALLRAVEQAAGAEIERVARRLRSSGISPEP